MSQHDPGRLRRLLARLVRPIPKQPPGAFNQAIRCLGPSPRFSRLVKYTGSGEMRVLEELDVIALLRAEVQKVGSVAAWAKSASLDRSYVSCAIDGRRPISPKLLRGLGLREAVVDSRPCIFDASDVRQLLRAEVALVGGQSQWARKHQISRPVLNKILRKRRLPPAKILSALGLRIVVISD
jgi:hypothetical protein